MSHRLGVAVGNEVASSRQLHIGTQRCFERSVGHRAILQGNQSIEAVDRNRGSNQFTKVLAASNA
jgi:hypothetical protein